MKIKQGMSFTVTTGHTLHGYKLRKKTDSLSSWADIVLDIGEDGNSGRIMIASDYGDWQRYWQSCGPFKEFLCNMPIDYAAGKFGESHHIDVEATIKDFKEKVFYARRSGELDAEEARHLYNLIDELGPDLPTDNATDAFYCIASNYPDVMKFIGHGVELKECVTPRFRNFWEKIWPAFIEQLKREIASNQGGQLSHLLTASNKESAPTNLNQMAAQKHFLNNHGIETIETDVFPMVKEEDEKRALALIWKFKGPGWGHYQERYVKHEICSKEEFLAALNKESNA